MVLKSFDQGFALFILAKIFRKKVEKKTAFLSDTNPDQLTLGGSDTHIFEGIANFHMCFEKIGT